MTASAPKHALTGIAQRIRLVSRSGGRLHSADEPREYLVMVPATFSQEPSARMRVAL